MPIQPPPNGLKKGKVRVLCRVNQTGENLICRNGRQIQLGSYVYNFDALFKGENTSPELLKETLVSAIRYGMMGGNSSVIPIGGPLKGKTSFLCYAAETALAWSLEVLKQQPRIKMRLSVIEGSQETLVDLINPDRPEIFAVEDPLLGPMLHGQSEMLIRSALPGLRLLRRCFARRDPLSHILVSLTFHLPNGAHGRLHLFDCARGGSAILSTISSFILDGGARKAAFQKRNSAEHHLLREALASTTNNICLVPHIDGNEEDKSLAILQAVSRMQRVRANHKRPRPGPATPPKPQIKTDCRSPLHGMSQSYISSCSEATSQDTVIYNAAWRGYQSDTNNFKVSVRPSQHGSATDYDGEDHFLDLPLPRKKPHKVYLSDQEFSARESFSPTEMVIKCKPKVQPAAYARTKHLQLMSDAEEECARFSKKEKIQMDTIREYPATDTEACMAPRQHKLNPRKSNKTKSAVRMVRMADGSIQLQTASSKTTLADSNSYERKEKTRSSANLKSSNSLKNLLKFKTSKSSSSLNRSPTNTNSIFHAAEMTMILPKRNLSEQERFNHCRELRMKYNQLLNRLPKKHKKKYEWCNANQDLYTAEHLVRLEIEVKKLEDISEQITAKNGNLRKFSFFGFRLAI